MMQKKLLASSLRAAFILLSLFSFHAIGQQANSLQLIKQHVSDNQQRFGLSGDDVSTLFVTNEYTDASTSIHHVYAAQKVAGLTVIETNFSLHTAGSTMVDANSLIPVSKYKVEPIAINISSRDAVSKLMDEIKYAVARQFDIKTPATGTDQVTIYKRNESSIWDIATRLIYYNQERLKVLQPAWEVQMMDAGKQHFWLAYIDAASGAILQKRDLILHCNFGGAETDANVNAIDNTFQKLEYQKPFKVEQQNRFFDVQSIPANQYRVYDLPLESPIDSIQQAAPHALSSRSGDALASPDGWHKVANAVPFQFTRGNNVWAFQDPSPGPLGGIPSADPTRTAYNNGGLVGAPSLTEPFKFDYPISLAAEPETYQKAAIVNLFYWNNLMHDVFYYMGFTEAAGNFEDSHTFSTGTKTGGVPLDAVLAQAQDGGGTNNANFLTLQDGVAGQMQMYLWTSATPDSLVQITSSTSGVPPAGTKYFSLQGQFNNTPGANTNLFINPVLNKQFVLIKKNALSTVGTDTEGCSTGQQSIALPPGNDVSGKIAVIERGTCSFVEKVLGAQLGGAVGAIIINNADGPPIAMGGTDAPANVITIPSVMVSKADGDILKAQLVAGATIIGSLKRNFAPAPKRDGDIDNGVISHEYGHGISTRLSHGLSGAEQGGEGWSDFVALYMTMRTNDLTAPVAGHPNGVLPSRSIGNYVTYQPYNGRGIREYPYSIDMGINPATFGYVRRPDYSETHSVGFVWCSMLYELMQTFIDQYGMNDDVYNGAVPVASNPPASAKGNNIATRLVIEAMKLQPANPTFVQERDAILKADTLLYGAKHACKIWAAFAKRGLGFSAVSGSNGLGDESEAFDVPYTACDPTQTRIRIEKKGPGKINNGTAITYTIRVTNKYPAAITGVSVRDTLPTGMTYQSASDAPAVTGNQVTWTLNLAANETKTLTVTAGLVSANTSTQSFSDDHEATAANWTAQNQGGLDTWARKTDATQSYSGSNYWFVPDTDLGGANTNLRTTNAIAIPANAELVFIHKYATEKGYDGGVVEVSQDNVTWTYLPPEKFVRGGYNAAIAIENNPLIGTATLAFSGVTDGYTVSIAKLDDYANKSIYIRFRFTTDAAGGSITNGGWWMDDVYVLVNRTEVVNTATAYTNSASGVTTTEGTNARSTATSAFILGGSALASNLGNLSAIVNKQTVDLSWKAFNEINTASFTIERKAQGESAFTQIGTVTSAGIGTQANSYKFNDATVRNGNQYQYRVKLLNRSGETYYTNIAVVNLGGKIFKADIYPNPADKVANLSITNPGAEKITINLFDAFGKKVATFNGGQAASQLIALPIQNLQAGTYWVEVNTTENHTTLRLVVNR